MAIIKKAIMNVVEDVKKIKLQHTVGENVN